MTDKNNPPAFPRPQSKDFDREEYYSICEQGGMTLRDYFAGQVLAGTAANQNRLLEINNLYKDDDISLGAAIATEAYLLADSMLKARQKGGDA